MTESMLARLIRPLRQRIALMLRRAVIAAVIDENPVQVMKLDLFHGETREGIERIQEYGFNSVPPEGGQVLVAFLDGECGHGVVVGTDDRRYRPRKSDPGDTMLYTDRDKDDEHRIYLGSKERFIHIRGNDITIHVDNAAKVQCKTALVEAEDSVTVNAGGNVDVTCQAATVKANNDITLDPSGKTLVKSDLECTGNIRCYGDITDLTHGSGLSMSRMRAIYNSHNHKENNEGGPGPTDSPLQKM